jgi:hypothetical protein
MIVGAFVLFAARSQIRQLTAYSRPEALPLLTIGGLLLVDGPIPEMRVRL